MAVGVARGDEDMWDMRMVRFDLTRVMKAALLTVAVASGTVPMAMAADDDWEAEKREFEREREELRAMVAAPRDTGWFEVHFTPLEVDRILLKDRSQVERVYHYMTYRLRNQVSDNAQYLMEHASNFNEVMDSIVKEHERASFDTEAGPRLSVEGVEAIEDPEMATIIDRPDLQVRDRVVNITVIATDEDGTRFRLFDPYYLGTLAEGMDPAWVFDEERIQGAQEEFDFPNYGDTRYGMAYQRVREAIEEKEGRRLLSVHEVRDRQLQPFNPEIRDDEGLAQGELYGVLIFDRLPVTGDLFTIQVQGLSNKLRFQGFEVKQAIPEQPDQVQDYFNARILRRTYQVTVSRPGDEYFLDQAPMKITEAGWVWEGAFNRIHHRSTMAYAKYFLDNIDLGEERMGPDGPVLHNEEVNAEFLEYWDKQIALVEERYQADLEEVQAQQEKVREHYELWLSEDDVDAEFVQTMYDRRVKHLQGRQAEIESALQELPEQLAEIKMDLTDAQKEEEN